MKNFGDNTYAGVNIFNNDFIQSGMGLKAVFADTTNNRTITINPKDGQIDITNSPLHLNRFTGKFVTIGNKSDSRLVVGQGNSDISALIQINNTIPGASALKICAASNQTANLFEIQDISQDLLFSISPTGAVNIANKLTALQFCLSQLNIAPISGYAPGTPGEIRIDQNYIYVCVGVSRWKRANLLSWVF